VVISLIIAIVCVDGKKYGRKKDKDTHYESDSRGKDKDQDYKNKNDKDQDYKKKDKDQDYKKIDKDQDYKKIDKDQDYKKKDKDQDYKKIDKDQDRKKKGIKQHYNKKGKDQDRKKKDEKFFGGVLPNEKLRRLSKKLTRLSPNIQQYYDENSDNLNGAFLGEAILTNILGRGKLDQEFFEPTPVIANASVASGYRVTVVSSDGYSMYDSYAARSSSPANSNVNSNTLPEFFSATINRGRGFASRVSGTTGELTEYVAKVFFLSSDKVQFTYVRLAHSRASSK